MSKALSQPVLEMLRAAVGDKGLTTDADEMAPRLAEERGLFSGHAEILVRPASTKEVAAVVTIAAQHQITITPQGGNTGLVGGGVPDGGIILSTERMNKIVELDAANHTMTVEAGCILKDIQDAASEAGCLFPLSLGAEGSCQIGGNLSTNAGGIGVLRYGNARDLVLGLEAVLPDGRIWNGLLGLRKNNTGYDLKQLFIGAEGTLGIITAAVLKLFPKPAARATAFVALATPKDVLSLFTELRDIGGANLTAFELIARTGLDFGVRHISGVRDPFDAPHAYYALVELSSPRPDDDLSLMLEEGLASALENGTVEDAVIAASETQAQDFWRIRETIPEAQKYEGGSIKHDVSVPVSHVQDFIEEGIRLVSEAIPGVRPCVFGHIGDGNIHFNLSQPEGMKSDAFLDQWSAITRIVHDLAISHKGSFSAEHGVGKLKREDLVRYSSDVEIDMMKTIKKSLDPGGIMNPGKIL